MGIYVSVLDVRWENCFLYIPEASISEGEGISGKEEVMGLSGNVQPIAGPNLRLCGELDCVKQGDRCASAMFLAKATLGLAYSVCILRCASADKQ